MGTTARFCPGLRLFVCISECVLKSSSYLKHYDINLMSNRITLFNQRWLGLFFRHSQQPLQRLTVQCPVVTCAPPSSTTRWRCQFLTGGGMYSNMLLLFSWPLTVAVHCCQCTTCERMPTNFLIFNNNDNNWATVKSHSPKLSTSFYLVSLQSSYCTLSSPLPKCISGLPQLPSPCGYMRRLDVAVHKAHNKWGSAWNSPKLKGCSHCLQSGLTFPIGIYGWQGGHMEDSVHKGGIIARGQITVSDKDLIKKRNVNICEVHAYVWSILLWWLEMCSTFAKWEQELTPDSLCRWDVVSCTSSWERTEWNKSL